MSSFTQWATQESRVQEHLWAVEDRIRSVQATTYSAEAICDYLTEVVGALPTQRDGRHPDATSFCFGVSVHPVSP